MRNKDSEWKDVSSGLDSDVFSKISIDKPRISKAIETLGVGRDLGVWDRRGHALL